MTAPRGETHAAAAAVSTSGGVVHPREPVYEGVYDNYPEVAHDPVTDRYLVVTWHVVGPAIDVYGHLVGADGLPFGTLLPIAASSDFEGGDGIGVAFQPRTGTYLVTYQGPADDTWAVEVDGAGAVSTPFAVIETPGRLNTQSRVVADALRARWLVTTNVDYTTVAGRFVEALPP